MTASRAAAGERSVLALLGPTNTGKTHHAIERMLEHESGMMGLPLRLLAREVYDRVTAKVGETRVALVTGEEKRVPKNARYWICTVEAMPDVDVDFLAVDEIQLAAHAERGHVFTDRLLHARGRLETYFLGADTIALRLRELVPDARIERRARLSALSHAGKSGLGGLPPRSAIVAFSVDDVYAIAARVRAKRGGAAVVLGALSPRTRNAQVAMYQAREVSYLVATDAIGMGLNLDVDHVAFFDVNTFDGKVKRPLEPDELAQIAGRAGRHRKDGTFGTLGPLALGERTARSIELHRFPPHERLVWRNSSLDFGSLDGLLDTLCAAPPAPSLVRVERADDLDALRTLAGRDAIRARARSPERIALLWEVCQVPDYRKLLLGRHAALLEEIYVQLVDHGRLDTRWLGEHVARVDRDDGELDQLTARLAEVRIWTYVSHRAEWMEDPRGWQERTRALEDRLSDALHARLVERFVEVGRKSASAAAPTGSLVGLRALWEDAERGRERARARAIDAIVDAPHEALALDGDAIVFAFSKVGRLLPGREPLAPRISVEVEGAGGGDRARIERRLAAFWRDFVDAWLASIRPCDGDPPALRGLLYQLERGLGTALRREVEPQLRAVDRGELARRGIGIGQRALFSEALHADAALALRRLLVRLSCGAGVEDALFVTVDRKIDTAVYIAMGLVPVARVAVRADELARIERALERGERLDDREPLLLGMGLRRTPEGRWVGKKRRRARTA